MTHTTIMPGGRVAMAATGLGSQRSLSCLAVRAKPMRGLICAAHSGRDLAPWHIGLMAAGVMLIPLLDPSAAESRVVQRVLSPFEQQQLEAQSMAEIIRLRRAGKQPSAPTVLAAPAVQQKSQVPDAPRRAAAVVKAAPPPAAAVALPAPAAAKAPPPPPVAQAPSPPAVVKAAVPVQVAPVAPAKPTSPPVPAPVAPGAKASAAPAAVQAPPPPAAPFSLFGSGRPAAPSMPAAPVQAVPAPPAVQAAPPPAAPFSLFGSARPAATTTPVMPAKDAPAPAALARSPALSSSQLPVKVAPVKATPAPAPAAVAKPALVPRGIAAPAPEAPVKASTSQQASSILSVSTRKAEGVAGAVGQKVQAAAPAVAAAAAAAGAAAVAASPENLLRTVGLLLGGGLAGYVVLLQKSSQAAQDALSSQIGNEQRAVADLRAQAEQVKSTLESQQTLVQQLRGEMASAAANSARLLDLERQEKAAGQRSAELVTKSLEAEKLYVEAVRREAAAALEQAEAERAAKFVAEAESREVARQLAEAQEQRQRDAQLAQQNAEAARAAQDSARAAQGALGDAVVLAQNLEVQLTAEQVRARDAESAAAELKLREEQALNTIREQEGRLKEGNREVLDMRSALGSLKQQALDIQARSQAGAEAATLERSALQTQLDTVNDQLEQERGLVAVSTGEIRRLKASLMESASTAQRLEGELVDSRQQTQGLMVQLRDLQSQVEATSKVLMGERAATAELRVTAVSLSSELQEVHSLLSRTADDLATERSGREALSMELRGIKAEYLNINRLLQEEQGLTAQLRLEATDLQRQIREVQMAGQQELQAQQAEARAEVESLRVARAEDAARAEQISSELALVQQQLRAVEADREAGADSSRAAADEYQRTAEAAQKRIEELQAEAEQERTRAAALVGSGDRLELQERELTERLSAVQAALQQAEADAAGAREDRLASAEQLQVVRADADAALAVAQQNAAALGQEREARLVAEDNLSRLRSQLDGLVAKQEAAKKESQGALAVLRNDFTQMRTRKGAAAKASPLAGADGDAAAADLAEVGPADDAAPSAPAPSPPLGASGRPLPAMTIFESSLSAARQARLARNKGGARAGGGGGGGGGGGAAQGSSSAFQTSGEEGGHSATDGGAPVPPVREAVEARRNQ